MPTSAEPASAAAIRHEPEASRFVLDVDGARAVLEYRHGEGGSLDLYHTFVPRALRGGGLASRLAAYALDYARDHGHKVVPSCPFVAAYIERHPEYRALL